MRGQALNHWAASLGICVSAAIAQPCRKQSYSDQIDTLFSLGMCSASHVADGSRRSGHMVNMFCFFFKKIIIKQLPN